MKGKITLLTLLGLCSFSAMFATQTIYVATTANGGSDENTGSVSSPFATISKAASMVSEDGAEIYVGAGTYVFGSTVVLNAYTHKFIGADAATTIFDGNSSVSLIDGVTSLQNTDKTVSFEKLAFKNARMAVVAGTLNGGAAIWMGFKTNLVLNQCYFANNISTAATGENWGGAVYFTGTTVTVDGCFFEKNESNSGGTQGYGGAITIRHLFNIDGSTTHLPSGATYAVVKNSTFYQNYAFSKGGAVYFNKQLDTKVDAEDATFVVQNCTFLENKSAGGTANANTAQLGAGVALSSGSNSTNNKAQTIILTNNTFINNYMVSAGTNYGKNSVLLEGFRYTSYMANNILISDMTNGECLFANQPAPIEYGSNNTIDKIAANINGADFVADAATKNNLVAPTTAAAVGINTTLSNYPLSATFALPYIALQLGSAAINAGINSYLVNTIANPSPATPVEYVLTTDSRGQSLESTHDLGAAEFISTTTALIEGVKNELKVLAVAEGFQLKGLNGTEEIRVFNLTGKMICKVQATAEEVLIPVTNHGVYLISTDNSKIKCVR